MIPWEMSGKDNGIVRDLENHTCVDSAISISRGTDLDADRRDLAGLTGAVQKVVYQDPRSACIIYEKKKREIISNSRNLSLYGGWPSR